MRTSTVPGPVPVHTPTLRACPAASGSAPGSALPNATHELRHHVAELPRFTRACVAHAWPAPAAGRTSTLSRPQPAAFGRWSQV